MSSVSCDVCHCVGVGVCVQEFKKNENVLKKKNFQQCHASQLANVERACFSKKKVMPLFHCSIVHSRPRPHLTLENFLKKNIFFRNFIFFQIFNFFKFLHWGKRWDLTLENFLKKKYFFSIFQIFQILQIFEIPSLR